MDNYILGYKVFIDGQLRSFRVMGTLPMISGMLATIIDQQGNDIDTLRIAPAKRKPKLPPNGPAAPTPKPAATKKLAT